MEEIKCGGGHYICSKCGKTVFGSVLCSCITSNRSLTMTEEKMIEIFKGDSGKWEGDNAFQGLQVLSKYTSNLIQGASHDTIYSEYIEKLIQAGITEEDCLELRRLNWVVEDNSYLACFV